MRALVTGGAGFIGGHIVDKLLERGYEVTVLDALEEPTHQNGIPNYLPKKITFIKGNVLEKDKVIKALEGVDVLFHEAATGGFTDNVSKYYEWNSLATAQLWEIIFQRKIKLKKVIVASSVAVYGEGKYLCQACGVVYPHARNISQLEKHTWEVTCHLCGKNVTALPTDIEKPVDPLLHYSLSKYDQERISILMGKKTNIPVVILRYFLTYGPRQSSTNPYTGVCSIFSQQLLQNKKVTLYEDGLQTRDFVYVEDVADANMFVLENRKEDNNIFNVGTGVATSIRNVAEVLAKNLRKKKVLNNDKHFRLGDVRHIYADITPLQKLGFRPKIALEEGLQRYLTWLTSQKKNGEKNA